MNNIQPPPPSTWFARLSAMRDIAARIHVQGSEVFITGLLALAHAGIELISMGTLYPLLAMVEKGETAVLALGWPFDLLPRLLVTTGINISLPSLMAAAFVPTLAKQLLGYGKTFVLARMGHRCRRRIQTETIFEIINADAIFFVSHNRGELNAAVMSHGLRAGSIAPTVAEIVGVSLLLVAYLLALFLIAPELALLTVAVASLLNLISHRLIRRGGELANAMTKEIQKIGVMVHELLQGMRLVKIRSMEDAASRSMELQLEKICAANIELDMTRIRLEAYIHPLLLIAALSILYVSVANFGLGLSALGIFGLILMRMIPLVTEINAHRFRLQDALAGLNALERISATTRRYRAIVSGKTPFPGLREKLAFNQVNFIYGKGDQAVHAVKNLSIEIRKGEMAALVGRSGAGKSTAIDMIPRFIDPSSGTISIDGQDLSCFDLRSLRRAISLVPQDPVFFDTSIRANIEYGLDSPLSQERLQALLDHAHCKEFVDALPQGVETLIGERGVRLSGGQRQRLAFARALASSPDILILDEPTSALDSESESALQATLASLHGTLTIIIIAHRLATIRQADHIFVMKDGTLAEAGRHDELAKRRSTYWHLFQLQTNI